MTDYIEQNSTALEFISGNSWVILNPIEKRIKEKIEYVGIPLKDWDISINYGIKTGCNEAFIIDKAKRDEIIAKDKNSAEIIRPILRGRDIKRYGYKFADLYLLFIPWHFPLHLDTTITGVSTIAEERFKEEYPTVYKHLLQYKDMLSARNTNETGIRYEWYALQRWGANYWEDFSKQKILWAETMRIHKSDIHNFPRFGFTKTDYFTDKTCFFATGEHLFYLLAYLNSSLGRYLCKRYVSILDNGGYLMQKIYLEPIPIIKPQDTMIREIELACKQIIEGWNNNLVLDINKNIYSLYDFSNDEIKYIENDNIETLSR
jgi:hypothetical protein